MEPIDAWLASAQAHREGTGRPLVTLTYAQSLDGSITFRRGQPLALSGPESQALTHRLRARHDAILVGIGTLLADDPRLTVRLAEGPDPQPVVLDSHLRFPLQAALLSGGRKAPWIATLDGADSDRGALLQAAGARLLHLPGEGGRISLPALLRCLGQMEVNSLMVEGGARVITSFLSKGLADLVIITISPSFVGGLHAVEAGALGGAGERPVFPRLQDTGSTRLGDDLIVWGRLSSPQP